MDKDYTILINRKHPLPEDFIPEHLVDIGLPFDAAVSYTHLTLPTT